MKKILLLGIVAVSLTGCFEEKVHDIDYYLEHKEEREKKVAECKKNPGELAFTPNCINADKAAFKIMLRSKEMPKIR